jgi:hypothetical protein
MLKLRNSRRKLAISKEMEYEMKLIAEEAEGNPRKKLNQSTEDLQIEGKNLDQTDQEFDIPHGKPNQEPNKDTKTKGRAHPRNTLASSTDTEGYENFWQTRLGHLICSETGQVLCSYCGIQSHGRKDCYFKKDDEAIKIIRVHHPDRGNLLSRNQQLLRMQPKGGASYKTHKSLRREGTWIRQFVPHASNNQGMANDINQNMDGWQRCNPYQEESQQPILRRKGQTERNSSTKGIPLTGYTGDAQRPCFPQGVSSTKSLKLQPVQRPSTSRIQNPSTCKARPGDQNGINQTTLNDMPNEVLTVITSYLTFKEGLRIGWT